MGPRSARSRAQLGADDVVDYATEDLVTRVKELTDGRGADVIYDPIGGDVFDASRRLVAFEGRILVIGFVAGRFAEAPTNHVLIKNYAVVGVHWAFYRRVAPEWIPRWQGRLERSLGAGQIAPLVGVELPLRRGPRGVAAPRVAGNDRESRAGALGGQPGSSFELRRRRSTTLRTPRGRAAPGRAPSRRTRPGSPAAPPRSSGTRHRGAGRGGTPIPRWPPPPIPFDCVSLDRAGLAATRHRLTSEDRDRVPNRR